MVFRAFQDIVIPKFGLGMMRLPVIDGDDSVIDTKETARIIDYAIQSGANYFDTAWGYHGGNSETVAGNILSAYPRDDYFLADKFPGYDNSNMPKVKEIFEEQLKKCSTDYFDFYLFHNVYEGNIDDYLDPKFGIMSYLLEQKRSGRIRHLGFSAHGSPEVIKRFLEAYGEYMEFCQLQLNYMDWHFQNAEEKYELVTEYGLPVWVMEPLRGGKLADPGEEMMSKLRVLRPDDKGVDWAFRFLQTLNNTGVVLSGMSGIKQIRENIDIWEDLEPLDELEFNSLITYADDETKRSGLPCTACHYCISHCPKGLPIPEIISYYNEHKLTGGGFIAPMGIGSMPEDKRPANCVGCRSCEKVCPQQIKISEVMKEFSAELGM